VTFFETDSFMKTMKRRRAVLLDSGRISWSASLTMPGAPLDELLEANMATMQKYLEFRTATPPVERTGCT
jgi:hypothetical protein